MSDETIQLIATAVVVIAQIYLAEPWKLNIFARMWDFLAHLCAFLAERFAHLSMRARANYYASVSV